MDDVRAFEFLDGVYLLPQNNSIAPFSTSADICDFLQAQWAGLFQRFLQEERRLAEIKVLQEMRSVAGTLQQLVTFLTEERSNQDEAIKNILVANHPAFRQFAELMPVNYRVFFTTKQELTLWLRSRGYVPLEADEWDQDSVAEWSSSRLDKYIKLTNDIFDRDGRLKAYSDAEWEEEWLQKRDMPHPFRDD